METNDFQIRYYNLKLNIKNPLSSIDLKINIIFLVRFYETAAGP